VHPNIRASADAAAWAEAIEYTLENYRGSQEWAREAFARHSSIDELRIYKRAVRDAIAQKGQYKKTGL